MYAIIDDGGKQYRAEEGKSILVDRKEAEPGTEVRFENVVLLSSAEGVKIGTPNVDGAAVVGVVEAEVKDKKIHGRHRTQRNRTQTRTGHRQKYTEVKITKIEA